MNYMLILLSACLFSLQFWSSSFYSKSYGNTWVASIKFSFYSSFIGLILLLLINRFQFAFSWFSMVIAIIHAGIGLLCGYCGMQAFRHGNLSVYSVFSMIGGMLLPSVYGMAVGEEITAYKVLCLILLSFAVYIASPKEKISGKGFRYYIGVFILNGTTGIVTKLHQSQPTLATDSASFMMISSILTLVFACILLFKYGKNGFALTKKAVFACTTSSLLNTAANFFLMVSLLTLPASLQFPFVTGGTIVFSTLFAFVRKEHVQKREIVGSAITLITSICMYFTCK